MTEKTFGKGEVVFREGETGSCFYQVVDGTAGVYVNYGKEGEKKLADVKPGQYFGELAIIEAWPRSGTIVAEEELRTIELAGKDLVSYFQEQPDRITALMNQLGGRIRTLTAEYDEVQAFIREKEDAEAPKKESFLARLKKYKEYGILGSKLVSCTVEDQIRRDNCGEAAEAALHVTLTCESAESGMILIVVNDLTDLVRVHSAFERYTSPEIADYVLTAPGGEKQGGQSREATILMSDLRGFTAMSTRLPSDQLITMLNHYFAEISAVITQHRGTVIEFLGDGIFVVFGAPQELPDHAEAAVRCAVEMQNALSRVNEWNREQGYPELEMGIGINSGPVVVGNIGSEHKMKYGCMGETVNLAGRLESFTLGGEVCISENTRKRIAAELKILGENSFMPKGGQEKMKYYSISGLGADCALQNAAGAIKWRTLPAAKEIDYSLILAGKAVDEESHKGLLTEISEDEKHGMLQSDRMLQPLQNLLLRLNGLEAYAKVTECGKRGSRISFTSKQDGFSELLR